MRTFSLLPVELLYGRQIRSNWPSLMAFKKFKEDQLLEFLGKYFTLRDTRKVLTWERESRIYQIRIWGVDQWFKISWQGSEEAILTKVVLS